ncbi:unnamed protein product [Larinioides sclopetarius]|uniref:Cytochrome b-c1 complex subunit 8 n=1 Tax=Larinioides sclopetarius TaxID=280406 RepID=A0AAV2AKD9_9ARAC
MAKGFGELAKIRGVIHYRLSPYEQNIFAGMFSKGLPNLVRRIRSQILYVAPRHLLWDIYFMTGARKKTNDTTGRTPQISLMMNNLLFKKYFALCIG